MFKSHSFIFLMIILIQDEKALASIEDIERKLDDRIDKENANFGESERRFIDNFNDAEWHVAHLKPTDFENTRRLGDENCKEETFAEKVRRYRKSLKNDAGRIDYVRAEPLQFDAKDLDEYKCIPKDKKKGNETVKKDSEHKASNKTKLTKETIQNKTNYKTGEATIEEEGRVTLSNEDKNSSVTPIANNVFKKHIRNQATTDKVSKMNKERDTRRGDYLFSSVEYEDDVADFDESECPDAVTVIILEQDQIRPYEVECELNLLWQSLE